MRLVYQLWQSDTEQSYVLLYEDDPECVKILAPDAKVVLRVEANSYEEAIQKQYDFLGWGTYTPDEIPFDYPPEHLRG